jgi:SAM-dependent methyltransferase
MTESDRNSGLRPDSTHGPFDQIYSEGGWGGMGSGPGSLPRNAQPYVDFVYSTLIRHKVSTVVDVGCGDWQMWPPGVFDNVRYVGYDVVASVIESNRAQVGSQNREFYVADAMHSPLPAGDLLLCKEVLQHLPNSTVHDFLERVGEQYRIVVVCDDIWMGSTSRWRRGVRRFADAISTSSIQTNRDIEPGEYRPLDYSLEPFADLKLARCLVYESFAPPRCKTIKAIWSSTRP